MQHLLSWFNWPLSLGITVAHVGEGDVVDIMPISGCHSELVEENFKFQITHKISQVQSFQHSTELMRKNQFIQLETQLVTTINIVMFTFLLVIIFSEYVVTGERENTTDGHVLYSQYHSLILHIFMNLRYCLKYT